MTEIDDAIGRIEALYRTVTGHEAPEATAVYAPIPAERDPVQYVQEQVDRLMQVLDRPGPQTFLTKPWIPQISIWETDQEILVSVDLPGVVRSDLDIQIQGTLLFLSGQRNPSTSAHTTTNSAQSAQPTNGRSEPTRPRVLEHNLGSFRRGIALPPGSKTTDITAILRDGVLEIRVPREVPLSATPRTVSVS